MCLYQLFCFGRQRWHLKSRDNWKCCICLIPIEIFCHLFLNYLFKHKDEERKIRWISSWKISSLYCHFVALEKLFDVALMSFKCVWKQVNKNWCKHQSRKPFQLFFVYNVLKCLEKKERRKNNRQVYWNLKDFKFFPGKKKMAIQCSFRGHSALLFRSTSAVSKKLEKITEYCIVNGYVYWRETVAPI